MRDPRRNFFRHGLAVIASAGLVAAVAVWLPRRSYHDFPLCFRDVEGVEPGTKVLYRGYPIGTVAAIEPVIQDTETRCGLAVGGCFEVTLRLHRPWELTSDAWVEIVPGLVGGATLHFDSGGSSSGGVRDACPGVRRRSPVESFPVVAKVEKLLSQINSQLSSSGNVSTILANLRQWSDPNDSKLVHLLTDLFGQVRETNQKVQDIAASVERMTGRIERIVASNEGSVGRSLSDLEYILDESSHSIGSMSVSLEGTAQNLLDLTQELRTNPLFVLTGRSAEDREDPHVRAGP